jgi:adenylylsulfate kinase
MSWAIWITGLPGSGKSTVARAAGALLAARGNVATILELDTIRRVLTPAARYTAEERDLVYRALVHVAALLVDEGVPVIVDATGHRREWRDLARQRIHQFAEVRLVCALEVCRSRERSRPAGHAPRGIYDAGGRAGSTVPGVDVPYEASAAELVVDTAATPLDATVAGVVELATALERAAPSRWDPGQMGWAMWVSGLPGSGKTTLTEHVTDALARRGFRARRLDVDGIRAMMVRGPSLDLAEEDLIHRTLVVLAAALTEVGVRVVIDAAGTRRAWRELARDRIEHFAEVQLVAPLGVCCHRERAVRWNLAGGGAPRTAMASGPAIVLDYEYSLAPELTLRTDVLDVPSAIRELLRLAERLERRIERSAAREEEMTMRVRDLMTRSLITVSPTTTVTEARALMSTERVRHLLVTDAGRLAGIVTDRDIRLNLASPATTLSVWELNYLLARLTVGEVMTKSVIVVDPERDAREAARIMLDHKIGALPVLESERLVGILTETDLVRAFAETSESAAVAR